MTKLVTLIYTESTRGKGTDGDPVRTVRELWTPGGQMVAWYDTHTNASTWSGQVEDVTR